MATTNLGSATLSCSKCGHPAHGKMCGFHKVVIDGELYDSGEVCTCGLTEEFNAVIWRAIENGEV